MRKVVASMLAMGLFVAVGLAQNTNISRSASGVKQEAPAQGEQRMKPKTPDEFVNEVDGVVGLTADQKVKVKALAENRQKQMTAMRDEMKSGTDKEAMRQKQMQFHKEQKAELDKILDPAQKAKWEAYRKQKRAEQGPPRAPRTPESQVNDLDAIVGLTAEQKVKVQTLAEAKETKMKALREEQKNTPDETVFKQKRHQIGQEYRTELDKILTPEQKAKWKAHREQMKNEKKGAPNK